MGGLGDEATLQKRMYKLQKERGAESHPEMTAPQSTMRSKPDCGEESYTGSGKLREKVVIVTGGDSGIGRAVVIAFAREGADICLVYRSHDEDARETAGFVERAGRRCVLVKSDIGRREACLEVVERCVAELGRLDCIVNNAGVQYEEKALDDVTLEHIDEIFRVNVFAGVWLAQAGLPHMKDHAGSTIIFNTSINSYTGNDHLISYSASKGAMTSLMRSMAKNLVGRGIRVNAFAPGPVWTPFITGTFDAQKCAEFGKKNPMERAGQPCECAPAAVFLASSDSSFITGHCIHVDGGQFMSS